MRPTLALNKFNRFLMLAGKRVTRIQHSAYEALYIPVKEIYYKVLEVDGNRLFWY